MLNVDPFLFDIILLTETWLKPHISDSEFINTSFFDVYRADRCSRRGGGAIIIIKNCITSKRIDLPDSFQASPDIDLIVISIGSIN